MNTRQQKIVLEALKAIAKGKERECPSGSKAFLFTRIEAQQIARCALIVAGEDWGPVTRSAIARA